MTRLLALDPGLETGAALMEYSPTRAPSLVARWQILDGVPGFVDWWFSRESGHIDEIVCESFILDPEETHPDVTPLRIEGALIALNSLLVGPPIVWQPRNLKAELVGNHYPPAAKTKAQRQRVRFDFLDRFGLFKAGDHFTDSNDAITHAIVNLKLRKHAPTLAQFYPQRAAPPALKLVGGF